jgi:hypothetical protein
MGGPPLYLDGEDPRLVHGRFMRQYHSPARILPTKRWYLCNLLGKWYLLGFQVAGTQDIPAPRLQ